VLKPQRILIWPFNKLIHYMPLIQVLSKLFLLHLKLRSKIKRIFPQTGGGRCSLCLCMCDPITRPTIDVNKNFEACVCITTQGIFPNPQILSSDSEEYVKWQTTYNIVGVKQTNLVWNWFVWSRATCNIGKSNGFKEKEASMPCRLFSQVILTSTLMHCLNLAKVNLMRLQPAYFNGKCMNW
jgi:hypothetical protein